MAESTRSRRSGGTLTVGVETTALQGDWELASASPGVTGEPPPPSLVSWLPAVVPGTVAQTLQRSELPLSDLEERDWWYRMRFTVEPVARGEQVMLLLGGLATIADVFLNGVLLLSSESMFASHELDVGAALCPHNELSICFRALAPRLQERRRPRARWRTRLVPESNLRFFRTMLLGRAPGFAPGPPVVGPWRAVELQRRRAARVDSLILRARCERGEGEVHVSGRVSCLDPAQRASRLVVHVRGPDGEWSEELTLGAEGSFSGECCLPAPERWWPHTHGRPTLYHVQLTVVVGQQEVRLPAGKIGFRTLLAAGTAEERGLDLVINDAAVFARGAVWTPLDLGETRPGPEELRAVLERVAACGMNMLRIPGTACYESGAFYDLCDELGILVWQDFMFANFDYPEQDPGFMAAVEAEARAVMHTLAHRPSLAVLCGGSEVAQQVAMVGLDPELANGPLFGELLPGVVSQAGIDAPYLPSAPCGGDLPFRTDQGVTNYFGVGAYLRDLTDVRRAEVKFASECLAFANVPDDDALDGLPAGLVHTPDWKAGVPRDAGAGWDFEDVRDHYLKLLLGLDPVELRWSDPERYLELSRLVSAEVMAEVFGEWRREGSSCSGGLVLWLRDLRPGAGWGVLDHRGEPKLAYYGLKRLLAPIAVWSTDEGLGGVKVHFANDSPVPRRVRVRVSTYREMEQLVNEGVRDLELAPHSAGSVGAESLLGRFVDINWSYRFGPPSQDLIAVTLEADGEGGEILSQAFRMPAGRPLSRQSCEGLGLVARVARASPTQLILEVSSRRFVYCLRVSAPGLRPADDGFSLEPGVPRSVSLDGTAEPAAVQLSAVNLRGRIAVPVQERA